MCCYLKKAGSTVAFFSVVAASNMAVLECHAQADNVYRCTDAAGAIVFSDRLCESGRTEKSMVMPVDPDAGQRKAKHDAIIARDKALADQAEAQRLADEQAGRAAQDQQLKAGQAIANKVEQERAQKNAAVVSNPSVKQSSQPTTLPPSSDSGFTLPKSSTPGFTLP